MAKRVLIDLSKPIDLQLEALAEAARSVEYDVEKSVYEVQQQAYCDFMTVVEELMHPMAWEEFVHWSLQATADEIIDEALRLLREE